MCPAVKNLRVALDMMDLLSYPRETRSVVLNRSDSRVGLSLEDVERVVRCPIAAQVPSSRAVPVSINTGTPITLASSGHPVSQAITSFARQRLLNGPAAAAVAGSAARPRREKAVGMSLSDRLAQRLAPGAIPLEQAGVPRRAARHADPFAVIKRSVHEALLEALGPRLYDAHLDQRELEQRVTQTLQVVLQHDESPLTVADRSRVAQEVADEILGHGPLEPYLRDPEVSEIMVNGHDQIYVERGGRLYPADTAFTDESHLRRTIEKIVARVGRRVDEASPMVDARLPDGSRVNAVVPPVALDGSLLTIRKFAADPFTMADLIAFGTMTPAVAELLRACVRGRLNIVIGGGTGSGKTTTLNVLSSFVPADERIITIEDAAELQLRQDHVLRMESRPPNLEGRGGIAIRDLVRNSLRMRPDRIIVGEVRDGAALDMLQAMNTGHDGSHHDRALQLAARLAVPAGDHGADGRGRTAAARHPRADGLGDRPDRAPGPAEGRHPADHPHHRGRSAWRATSSRCRTCSLFDFHAGVDERGRYRGATRHWPAAPRSWTRLADRGIPVPPEVFGVEGYRR